jgi:hypothetical protein
MLPSHVVPARRFRLADSRRVGGGARTGRERGAVLVHAAVAMTGLLAFSALTIDIGTVWVARAQAQNAVDAAALSGAASLAYLDPTNTDAAIAAARAIGQTHDIWGDTITPALLTVTAGSCPSGSPAVGGDCLNVAVERGGAAGSPLPVFFSRLFGGSPTRLRASASAKALIANVAPCPRPIGLPDRWTDIYPTPGDGVWRDDDLYARYDINGVPNIPPASADSYDPPGSAGPGSGITVADFSGVRVTRRVVSPTAGPLGADNLIAIDLPRPDGHPEAEVRYWQNLGSCSGVPLSIGATAGTVPAVPSSYTEVPLQSVIDADPLAYWDAGAHAIRGGDPRFPISPRLIALPVIDPDAFSHQDRSPGHSPTVVVRNVVGFFLEEVGATSGVAYVTGVIVPMPGGFDAGAPMVDDEAAFLRAVALVR